MQDFIDDFKIYEILNRAAHPEKSRVEEIITKARKLKGITPEETALLLQTEDAELLEMILAAAREIKQAIYGNRLVLFAPLYIANHCSNDCLYCGFRRSNRELTRVALTMEQIASEVRVLEREGHKRLLMLCGEHPSRSSLDYFIEAIETAYAVRTEGGGRSAGSTPKLHHWPSRNSRGLKLRRSEPMSFSRKHTTMRPTDRCTRPGQKPISDGV